MEYQLSIIIPTCNRHDSLTRAIDSVLYQGLDKIEIVIVNDGDNEIPKTITDLYSSYLFILFINNSSDRGAANARNFGVENSHGLYISFLDDDDVYLPGRLINMMAVMVNENYVFVSSGRFYEVGDFVEIQNAPCQYKGEISLEDIKYGNDIDIGFMISRINFRSLGGFDPAYTNLEDWDFVIRMLRKGNGYKLGRLDYAVNINPNRTRVSTNDFIGHREIAEKYMTEFGMKWYLFTKAMADRLENKLTFGKAVSYTLLSRSKLPLILYIKYKLQFIKKYSQN